METIQELLGSVRDSFFQLIENIIEWFQSLRGTKPEISNDEMPSMQKRTMKTMIWKMNSMIPSSLFAIAVVMNDH